MSTPPVWRGTQDTQVQPNIRRKMTSAGERIMLQYRGVYTTLLAARPAIGATVAGYANFYVDEVELVADGTGESGAATMTVVLLSESWTGTATPAIDLTEEVEWSQIEKPIEQHPRYLTGGDNALTDADLDAIEEWKNATAASDRSSLYGDLSANAKHLVDKLRRGTTSYIVPAPIARKTTKGFEAPTSSAQGVRTESAPITGAPGGYVWLGTADRAVRQGGRGKWERVQEWTGADEWDSDLY